MAYLYFMSQDGNTELTLDSETEISVSLPSTVTKSSVSSGQTASHEVIEGNIVITTSGIVTYNKTVSSENNPNPITIQQEIQKLRRSGVKFTVYTYDNGQPLLQDYPNCVISDVNFTATKYTDTIQCAITFEQVFVSEAAKKSFLAPLPSKASAPTNNSPEDNGQGTKTAEEEQQTETIAYGLVNNGVTGLDDFTLFGN